ATCTTGPSLRYNTDCRSPRDGVPPAQGKASSPMKNNAAPQAKTQVIAARSLFFRVFPSIMLPMFLAVIDQTIVATALPAIAASLGGVERVSWVVISYPARRREGTGRITKQGA